MKFPTQGLYAITQTEGKSNETIIQEVDLVIKGGASVVQYRDKRAVDKYSLAKHLLTLCHSHQIPLIINDDAELAHAIGADGVHIGQNDDNIATARKIIGKNAMIGCSCYNSLDTALKAKSKGVDYVAFGRFFPSNSKPLALPAEIAILTQAKKQINLPLVAIGGIVPKNGKQLLNAGADLLAVIGGLFEHDPEQSAKNYLKLFKQ